MVLNKIKFKNYILTDTKYKFVFLLAALTILKIILGIIIFTSLNPTSLEPDYFAGDRVLRYPEGYIELVNTNENWLQAANLPTDNPTLLFLFAIIIGISSLIIRITLAVKLRNDARFTVSGFSLSLYRTLLICWPTLGIVKLISKSYSLGTGWTVEQLIKKWKILNITRDTMAVLLGMGVVILGIWIIKTTYALTGGNPGISGASFALFVIILIIALVLFIVFVALLPVVLISAYSAEVYNEIRIKTQSSWTVAGFVFFMPFPFIKAYYNIEKLKKQLKDEEQEIENTEITNKLFYSDSIFKTSWHIFSFVSLIFAIIIAISKISGLNHSVLDMLIIWWIFASFGFYLVYTVPRYISSFVLIKKQKNSIKALYILDIFIPIVSIYNIIKYRKEHKFLV